MPASLQSALDRALAAVRQFSLAQRTLALIGVAVVVLGAIALSSFMSRPTLSPLFTGLSGEDASAVVDQLEADGVKYELTDGGGTVLVPSGSLYGERIKLAAAGLPANADGGGYSLLDEMPMTSSEFQQEKTYQRAMEGELAKTISAISGVDTATVKLAIPAESVFVSEKSDPTASVFVRTKAGAELSADQVQAIVHLVSAGIDGMTPTDVAVIDASGEVLSAVGTGALGGTGGEAASDYEARVAASVQAVLEPMFGAGKSAVTVTAEIDNSDTSTTTEEFSATPDTPPLASSETTEEYTGGGAGGATGVLGPDNIAVPGGGEAGDGTYTSTSKDSTNAVNKSTETTHEGPGAVERQSVAVVVDAEAAGAIDMVALEATIAAAAGIDAARGDTVAVQRVAFDSTQAETAQDALAAADAQEKAEAQASLLKQAAIGGGVLLLLVVISIVMAIRSRRARRTALDLGELSVSRTDDNRLAIEGAALDLLPELPPAPIPHELDPVSIKRAEISALADEQPDEVAELLRGWLAGSGSGRS